MGVVNVKSGLITNRDASPPVANRSYLAGGTVRRLAGYVTVTNGDSIASIFRLAEVPSNASIHSIKLFCDAITSAAADIGLYQNTANGSAVVDVDAYATAQSIATESKVGLECMFEARAKDKVANQVWQDGGLTSDPQRMLDICATLTVAATATGVLAFVIEYSY